MNLTNEIGFDLFNPCFLDGHHTKSDLISHRPVLRLQNHGRKVVSQSDPSASKPSSPSISLKRQVKLTYSA